MKQFKVKASSLSTEEQSLIYLPLPLTGDPGVMVDEATNDLIYLPLPLNR
jgi:hypothetical protein